MICVVLERAITVIVCHRPLQVSLLFFKLLLSLLRDVFFFVVYARHLKLVLAKLFFTFTFKFLVKFLLEFLSFSLKFLLKFQFKGLELCIEVLFNVSLALFKLINEDLVLE